MEDEELNVEWKQKSRIILLEALNELEVRKGKNSTFTLHLSLINNCADNYHVGDLGFVSVSIMAFREEKRF